MKRVVVLGNGNSGANTANYLDTYLDPFEYQVEYYYEYPPHSGFNLQPGLNAKRVMHGEIDIFSIQDATLIFSCGWTHKLDERITTQEKCYNIHPALLPRYRGTRPIERQLAVSETSFGITLHRMDKGFDIIFSRPTFDLMYLI